MGLLRGFGGLVGSDVVEIICEALRSRSIGFGFGLG